MNTISANKGREPGEGRKARRAILLVLLVSLILALGKKWANSRGRTLPEPVVTTIFKLEEAGESGDVAWDGKRVQFEGLWNAHIDGLSIREKGGPDGDIFILVRPAPGFAKRYPSWFERGRLSRTTLPSGEKIRVSGIFHTKGYGSPNSLLSEVSWVEFDTLETWDPALGAWIQRKGMLW